MGILGFREEEEVARGRIWVNAEDHSVCRNFGLPDSLFLYILYVLFFVLSFCFDVISLKSLRSSQPSTRFY